MLPLGPHHARVVTDPGLCTHNQGSIPRDRHGAGPPELGNQNCWLTTSSPRTGNRLPQPFHSLQSRHARSNRHRTHKRHPQPPQKSQGARDHKLVEMHQAGQSSRIPRPASGQTPPASRVARRPATTAQSKTKIQQNQPTTPHHGATTLETVGTRRPEQLSSAAPRRVVTIQLSLGGGLPRNPAPT